MMTFCKLEKDGKTYEYVKKYIIWYMHHQDKDFFELDAQVQAEELKKHLENNNFENKNQEILEWIKKYSEKFRMYLNTIKIVFAIWHCTGDTRVPNWEQFCNIVERVDEIKESCLDSIMLEGRKGIDYI